MTFSIAMDDNYDLFLDERGNLATVIGAKACAQNSRSAMSAQRGEMVLAMQRGIPTMATVFSQFDPAQFEAAARIALRRVPGVLGVTAFDVMQVGTAVEYTTTLLTEFGVIELVSI